MSQIILLIALLFFIGNFNRNLAFWLMVTLYIDPGGYITKNLIELKYILPFFIAFFPISSHHSYLQFKKGQALKPIRLFLPFLFYIIIFYFIILNNQKMDEIKDYLYLGTYLSPLILIPFIYNNIYMATKKNPLLPLWVFGIAATVIGILFLLSTQFGFDFLQLRTFSRYGLDRIVTYQYGNHIFTPLIFITLFWFKSNKKSLNILIALGAILGLYVFIIDMSRGKYVSLVMIFFMIIYIRKQIGFRLNLMKIIIASSLLFIVIAFAAVDYLQRAGEMFTDTYDSVTTGVNTSGVKEKRFSKDMYFHLELFNKNKVLGVGYNQKWYTNGRFAYSASDLPLTGGLAMFGILGTLLYLYFVIGLLKMYLHLFRKLKKRYVSINFYLFLSIIFSAIVIVKYLIPFYWFQEIIRPQVLFIYFTFIAMSLSYINLYSGEKTITN